MPDKLKIRKPFEPVEPVRKRFLKPSLAKQSFKDECDINHIVARYQKTGVLDHYSNRQGDYSDLPRSTDYHAALNAAVEAQDCFNSLPSSVRSRFQNDPEQFLAFVEDPSNKDEMYELGLAKRPTPAKPSPAEDAPLPAEEPAAEAP